VPQAHGAVEVLHLAAAVVPAVAAGVASAGLLQPLVNHRGRVAEQVGHGPAAALHANGHVAERVDVEVGKQQVDPEVQARKSAQELLEQELSQIIIKDERPILAFMLKYFMKESAKISSKELDLRKILGRNSDKVSFMNNRDEYKRFGIIDKKISFEFVSIPAKNSIRSREYIGYLSQNPSEVGAILH
jgi:hypothetical protein